MKPSGFLRPKGAIGKEPLRTVDLQHQSLRRELQNAGAWGLGLQGFDGFRGQESYGFGFLLGLRGAEIFRLSDIQGCRFLVFWGFRVWELWDVSG